MYTKYLIAKYEDLQAGVDSRVRIAHIGNGEAFKMITADVVAVNEALLGEVEDLGRDASYLGFLEAWVADTRARGAAMNDD